MCTSLYLSMYIDLYVYIYILAKEKPITCRYWIKHLQLFVSLRFFILCMLYPMHPNATFGLDPEPHAS